MSLIDVLKNSLRHSLEPENFLLLFSINLAFFTFMLSFTYPILYGFLRFIEGNVKALLLIGTNAMVLLFLSAIIFVTKLYVLAAIVWSSVKRKSILSSFVQIEKHFYSILLVGISLAILSFVIWVLVKDLLVSSILFVVCDLVFMMAFPVAVLLKDKPLTALNRSVIIFNKNITKVVSLWVVLKIVEIAWIMIILGIFLPYTFLFNLPSIVSGIFSVSEIKTMIIKVSSIFASSSVELFLSSLVLSVLLTFYEIFSNVSRGLLLKEIPKRNLR